MPGIALDKLVKVGSLVPSMRMSNIKLECPGSGIFDKGSFVLSERRPYGKSFQGSIHYLSRVGINGIKIQVVSGSLWSKSQGIQGENPVHLTTGLCEGRVQGQVKKGPVMSSSGICPWEFCFRK